MAQAYILLTSLFMVSVARLGEGNMVYSIAGCTLLVMALAIQWTTLPDAIIGTLLGILPPIVSEALNPTGHNPYVHIATILVAVNGYTNAANRIGQRILRRSHQRAHRLTHLARHDYLTGLLNRQHWMQDTSQIRAAIADRPGGCILFIDIDNFKHINDQHGHLAGDRVLSRVANLIVTLAPDDAINGRFGGEEFVSYLPDATVQLANLTADHLRTAVMRLGTTSAFPITISIGIAEYRANESLDHWIGRADTAMLQAKSDGRNRIMIAGDDHIPRSANRHEPNALLATASAPGDTRTSS